jgi:hypothetical protein
LDASRSSGSQLTTDWESNLMPLNRRHRQGGCFNPPCATTQDLSCDRFGRYE